jgi:hypothetical protein
MLRAIVFFGLAVSAFASETLDALASAAASFSAAIQQQLEKVRRNRSPAELAEKTVAYTQAKTAYLKALREELPELNENRDGQGRAAS